MPSASTTGSGPFRARDFARIAGVTVRALHHYDRVGLLKPARTRAGHRSYGQRDLERLRRILALRTLGVPLKEIAKLLDARAAHLETALMARRSELVGKKREIDRLIAAIDDVTKVVRQGATTGPALLQRILEVMEMKDEHEEWADLVRTTSAHRRSLPPGTLAALGRQGAVLIGEVQQLGDRDPKGPAVQALAARWVDLLRRVNGPDISIERLIRSGLATQAQLLERAPQMASSPWSKAVSLMTRAVSITGGG